MYPRKALQRKWQLCLKMLGCQHALVVHGEDGLDEITTTGKTFISELKQDNIKNYEVTPEDVRFVPSHPGNLKGGTAKDNADCYS